MNTPTVTASELADYIYCECCWADKIDGEYQQTAEMLEGGAAHNRLQWQYTAIEFAKQVAVVVVIGCGILLGVVLAVTFFLNR